MQEFFQDAALLNLSDFGSQPSSAASRQLPASFAPPSSITQPPPMTASPHTITHTLTQHHHHNVPHSMALPQPKNLAPISEASPGRQQVSWLGETTLSTSSQPTTSSIASCQNSSSTDSCRQQLNNVPASSTTSSIQRLRSFSFSKLPPHPHPVCAAGLSSENPAKRRAVFPKEDTLSSTTVATCEVPTQFLSSPIDQPAPSTQRTSTTPSLTFPRPSQTAGTLTPRSTCVLSQGGYTVLPSTPRTLKNTPIHANSTNLTLSTPSDPHKVSYAMTTPITTPTRPPIHGVGTVTPIASGQHIKRKFPGPAGILPKLVR